MIPQAQKSFLEIIEKCLQSDNAIRNQGEKEIKEIARTNFAGVLLNCSLILMGEEINFPSRQMSSTILKNSIKSPEGVQLWEVMSPELKEQIKGNVLSCLGSSNPLIRKSAANSVAAIAKIDLPRGEWTALIKTLSAAAQHSDINFQLTAITTLGYISQEIPANDISFEERQLVINTVIPAMNTTQDKALLHQAIVSLTMLIDYLYENMKLDDFRKCLFTKLFEYIKSPNEDISIASLQCLNDICRVYYDDIAPEFDFIAKFILGFFRSPNEKVGIQAVFFWVSISEEEIARINAKRNKARSIKQYCQTYKEELWTEVKVILLNRNAQLELKEENTRYATVSTLLENLSKCIDVEIIAKVSDFMRDCFASEDTSRFIISIYAFTSILETCYYENIKTIIPHFLPFMSNFIQKDSQELQYQIGVCLVKICEVHADCFMDPELFRRIIQMIKSNLHLTQKVVCQLVSAIHCLAKKIKQVNSFVESSPFSPYLNELLGTLLGLAYTPNAYNKNHNVAIASFISIGTLIETSSPNDQKTILAFFASIYEGFQKSMDKSTFNHNEEMRNDYQGYLASVICAYLAGAMIPISLEQGEMLYDLIRRSFDERKSVYEEGLAACSSLALTMKENYSKKIMESFMGYVLFALRNWSDNSICNQAFLSLSDLIRGTGVNSLPFIPQIMKIIMEIISQDTDKSLKLKAILVFTDIFSTLDVRVWSYYNTIMAYISNALEAAVLLPDESDVDLFEYYQKLRERLLEFIATIVKIVIEANKSNDFHCYLQSATTFIDTIAREEYSPSIDIALHSAGAIYDLCRLYNSEINSLISDKCIITITKLLKSSECKPYVSLAELAQQSMLRIRIKAEYEKYGL